MDQAVESRQQLGVMRLPVEVVFPRKFREDDLDAGSIDARSVPPPASSSAIAFNSRGEIVRDWGQLTTTYEPARFP